MINKNPYLYYSRKILIFILSVFLLSIAVFYVARLAPGDALFSYYGSRVEKMSPKERERAEKNLVLMHQYIYSIYVGLKMQHMATLAYHLNTRQMYLKL